MCLHGNLMFEGVILHVSSHKLNFGVRVCKNKITKKIFVGIRMYEASQDQPYNTAGEIKKWFGP